VLAGVGIEPLGKDDGKRIGELLALARSSDVVEAHVALMTAPADLVLTGDAGDMRKATGRSRTDRPTLPCQLSRKQTLTPTTGISTSTLSGTAPPPSAPASTSSRLLASAPRGWQRHRVARPNQATGVATPVSAAGPLAGKANADCIEQPAKDELGEYLGAPSPASMRAVD
jgi:hypothetical protein